MRKMLWCFVLVGLLFFTGALADAAAANHPPILRALLVGVDTFANQPDTAPSAENNLNRLSQILRFDRRGYYSIRRSLNQSLDAEGFAQMVRHAFGGADDNDWSLFYISTHGLYGAQDDPMDFAMVLSDGETDYHLSARELYGVLQQVPGQKVLIIDTCYSGALIDRGLPGSGLRSLFTGEDYRVLTASGGSEPSFLWTTGQGRVEGGSYFADALSSGLSPAGRYAADGNRDGLITLRELHSFLLENYGVSTPQAYPYGDDEVVFAYAKSLPTGLPRLITAPVFYSDTLSPTRPVLEFSYTLARRSRVAYQFIYRRGGAWGFHDVHAIIDSELATGETSAGRKERNLTLTALDVGTAGYALMILTTVEEDRSTPHTQRLLLVEAQGGDPDITVVTGEKFVPSKGEEMPITMAHAFPVRYSARVLHEDGTPIATLAREVISRPNYLPWGSTLLYWTGIGDEGQPAAPGLYYVEASTRVGDVLFTARSRPFALK